MHALQWSSYGHEMARRLQELRQRRGMSQQQLGERAGLSRNQVSNLERNENNARTSDPLLSTIYRIAAALEVPPAAILPAASAVITPVCPAEAFHEEDPKDDEALPVRE